MLLPQQITVYQYTYEAQYYLRWLGKKCKACFVRFTLRDTPPQHLYRHATHLYNTHYRHATHPVLRNVDAACTNRAAYRSLQNVCRLLCTKIEEISIAS